MTDPQIRFWQLKENQRHNIAQEANWQDQLSETVRANKARESLTKYQTDVSADTARYAANTQAATARYVSDQNYSLGQYTAGLNAETQRYASDQATSAQRYSTDVNAATQRSVAGINAVTQRYATNVNAALQSERLAFDKQTQSFRNRLEAQKVELQRLSTNANVAYSQAQAQRAYNDIRVDLARLEQDAQRLDLDKTAAKFNNALTLMRTWESFAKSAESGSRTMTNLTNLLEKVWKLLNE